MVAMVLGMSSTEMFAEKNNYVSIDKFKETVLSDTTLINSIEYKEVKKFDHYELNFNTNLSGISKFLKLDEEQKVYMFDVNNSIAREFARLNTIEDFNERSEWFIKVMSQTFKNLKYVLNEKQLRDFKQLVNTTLQSRGFLSNGKLVDLYANKTVETK